MLTDASFNKLLQASQPLFNIKIGVLKFFEHLVNRRLQKANRLGDLVHFLP